MTVFREHRLRPAAAKAPQARIGERVERILDIVNLTGFERRYPTSFPAGSSSGCAGARPGGRAGDLLLDEPLSNLDANLREQMRFEIRRIHERTRVATIYVTHDRRRRW